MKIINKSPLAVSIEKEETIHPGIASVNNCFGVRISCVLYKLFDTIHASQ